MKTKENLQNYNIHFLNRGKFRKYCSLDPSIHLLIFFKLIQFCIVRDNEISPSSLVLDCNLKIPERLLFIFWTRPVV